VPDNGSGVSRNSTERLSPAICVRQCAITVSAVRFAPAPATMTAWTVSPYFLSGIPITATSATPGIKEITFSTSAEYTFSPPEVIMSLSRSTMKGKPSSSI
jgi:hypothetical protein